MKVIHILSLLQQRVTQQLTERRNIDFKTFFYEIKCKQRHSVINDVKNTSLSVMIIKSHNMRSLPIKKEKGGEYLNELDQLYLTAISHIQQPIESLKN